MVSRDTRRALRELQQLARAPTQPSTFGGYLVRAVPEDLATADRSEVVLRGQAKRAFRRAIEGVRSDLWFEHLDRTTEDRLWRFVCLAVLRRDKDHVDEFIREYANEPASRICWFPIEWLTSNRELSLAASVLHPVTAAEVPGERLGFFSLQPPVGSVQAVEVTGTNLDRMAERARAVADQDLAALRVALRSCRGVHDQQLRFCRATGYSFGGDLVGWRLHEDHPIELGLGDSTLETIRGSALLTLPITGANGVQKKARLALGWIERALLSVDPLESLLFGFFALEALLGDTNWGKKAHLLAFRRALLEVATRGSFANPNRLYLFYGEVRSAAVHGSAAPPVDITEARRMVWDVRDALIEYLEFGATHGCSRHSQLLTALDGHHDRASLLTHLKEFDGALWQNPDLPPTLTEAEPPKTGT